jgi:hypothetical protein
MWDSADWRAVVFVSDRSSRALHARERCLRLAGIPHSTVTERRPSGTYFKLCVREEDAVDAHLALRLGGFCRSVRLQRTSPTVTTAVIDMVWTAWDQALDVLTQLVDLVRSTPRLLPVIGRAPLTD